MQLSINGKTHEVDVDPETPLLWVLRDHMGLTGTKYGCGAGQCGACTVHVDGHALRSCVLPVATAVGTEIWTIEGIVDSPVVETWIAHEVAQCGYCQSGQIMQASALLRKNPRPTVAEVESEMTNLCRCGTYDRIRKAVLSAAEKMPLPSVDAVPAPGAPADAAGGGQ